MGTPPLRLPSLLAVLLLTAATLRAQAAQIPFEAFPPPNGLPGIHPEAPSTHIVSVDLCDQTAADRIGVECSSR